MNKMLKTVLAAALAACFAVNLTGCSESRRETENLLTGVNGAQLSEPVKLKEVIESTSGNERSYKIDERLWEIMHDAEDDEPIPVSIWISGIDFEEVEKRVEAEIGLSRSIIDRNSDKPQNELFDDVQAYTSKQREIAKEMTARSNADFVGAYLSGAENIQVYDLFPIIDCAVTKEKILYLAALNGVESISSNDDKNIVYPFLDG